MWNLLPYIMAGVALLVVFSCLIYFLYLSIGLKKDLLRINRQSNTCPQGRGLSRDENFNDIFFIEPNSQEAARIRAQLEKDDKDLPSYDEVMHIANFSTPTAASNNIPSIPSALAMGASGSSVNTITSTIYRETEANVTSLTPPPYTPEPTDSSLVLPVTTSLYSQQNTQSK